MFPVQHQSGLKLATLASTRMGDRAKLSGLVVDLGIPMARSLFSTPGKNAEDTSRANGYQSATSTAERDAKRRKL